MATLEPRKASRLLKLAAQPEPTPPPDRGRLLTPEQVATELFEGHVTPQWVRRNVRPKVVLGHSTVMFYELDVRQWIESRRQGVA